MYSAACKYAVLDLITQLVRGPCCAACKGAVLDLITQLVRGPCGAACKDALLNPAAMKSVLGAGLMHPLVKCRPQKNAVPAIDAVSKSSGDAVLGEFGEQTLLECSGLN
jgi:hypothetical protein